MTTCRALFVSLKLTLIAASIGSGASVSVHRSARAWLQSSTGAGASSTRGRNAALGVIRAALLQCSANAGL
eukprot:3564149-Pleurochrysis_carterae.AAC.1